MQADMVDTQCSQIHYLDAYEENGTVNLTR